jgi:dTDP-4-dehydrorhamnose 3,5-epimerase
MIFTEAALPGAFVIDIERHDDDRGFFARSFCREEFASRGIEAPNEQCSLSYNARRGTLRGMHYQAAPHEESKLVRCTAGAIFDVIVDLREKSPTHRRWYGAELSAANRRSLFVPKGVAHGFVTLADATEVLYMISPAYAPEAGRGFAWNDAAIAIEWPIRPVVISARDAGYPQLDAAVI